jgi:hypothetical protein
MPRDDDSLVFNLDRYPKVITVEATPEQRQLWSLPREEAELVYAQAIDKNDLEALRWLCQNDRYFLLSVALRRADTRKDWLYDRCREVEADPDDRLDLWAREHYKSTIITFAGIIQEILRDPEITIGIFAHNRPTAKSFLRQIMQEFEMNEFLQQVFPDIVWSDPRSESPKWSEDEGLVLKRKSNPKESTLEAWGLVDGMPTGKHFRLRVYDDVVTEKSVTNADMITKTTDMFDLSDDLGTHGGRMWMIGTRYHFGDTYGVVLDRGLITERRHPATDDGTFEGTPVFLTDRDWKRKLTRPKSIVAAQQLLNPLAGAETTFQIKNIRFWERRPKTLNVYITCDPSKGKNATSDRTAMTAIGVDAQMNKYLLDGICHRMNLSQRWSMIKAAYSRWSGMPGVAAVFVGYEQFGMQTDMEYFDERMRLERRFIPIQELAWPRSGPGSKKQRIERLEPDFRMGKLMLPKTVTISDAGVVTPYDNSDTRAARELKEGGELWRLAKPIKHKDEDGRVYDFLERFVEEYTFFPFAPHDDILDACSRIHDMQVVGPVFYDHEPGRANSVEPEIFVDGI